VIHKIPYANWTSHLARLIDTAADGDTIQVHTEAMQELAEMARERMCPEKKLNFIIVADDPGQPDLTRFAKQIG